MTVGPIQLVVIGFEGDVLESQVLDEIDAAVATGDIRLIDFLVVEKDEDGVMWGSEVSVFTEDDEEGTAYGALTFDLIDQDLDETSTDAIPERWAFAYTNYVMASGEINEIVHQLPKGSSAIVVLFEHAWARKLHAATLEAGGVMLAQGMVEPLALAMFQNELEAIQEAAEVIEAAQAVETEAMLEAAEAVLLSEAIQAEAAEKAINALVTAELIEEAAIEEARQVLLAALMEEDEDGGQ